MTVKPLPAPAETKGQYHAWTSGDYTKMSLGTVLVRTDGLRLMKVEEGSSGQYKLWVAASPKSALVHLSTLTEPVGYFKAIVPRSSGDMALLLAGMADIQENRAFMRTPKGMKPDILTALNGRYEDMMTRVLLKRIKKFIPSARIISTFDMPGNYLGVSFDTTPKLTERLAVRKVMEHLAGFDENQRSAAWEVLRTRIEGQSIQKHIREFLDQFIVDGQKISSIVRKAEKIVEGYVKHPIDPKELERAVWKEVEFTFGDDKMAKLLAKVIAHGEFIF